MWKVNTPNGRIAPKLRPFRGTLKVMLASNVVTALIVGYALSLKVFHINTFGFGLYFLFIVTDFLVQFSSAIYNRRRVNAIAKKARAREQRLLQAGLAPKTPRIMITAVGYREDGEAWKKCLQTLDIQHMLPQGIVCCVDGNDAPDMEMAKQFEEAYADRDHRVVHLQKTLASVYKDAYEASLKSLHPKPRSRWHKFKWWLTSIPYPEETASHLYARKILYAHMKALHEEHDFTQCYRTLYTQPHGDKRTAMFTAFAICLFLGSEAVFATDSDTLLEPTALQEMWILLDSDPNYGAVTADVHIENWKDSFISLQSRLRYWMAFNIERACQSTFRCVTCISGPMALYRACDLDSIIGMWLCQSFLGVHTTFGDDRHLTNCLLGKGLKTAYTHRTCCHSESPSSFIRWIRQQTRWSKSFYREAIWFPRAFAYHHIWLGVETMKQGLYPFILLATVFNILYGENPWLRLVTWAATMFGTAAFKGFLAFIISKDWRMVLFPGYPLLYFFGLLPSKLLALSTMGKTNWGTSARTASERGRGESLGQKSWHVGHLAVFYIVLITGLAHFLVHITGIVWLWFVPFAATVPVMMLYWDELPFKYWILAIRGRNKPKSSPIKEPALVTVPVNISADGFYSQRMSDTTLVSKGVESKASFGVESSASSSVRPEASLTSEQILTKPRPLQSCSRSSSALDFGRVESVDPFSSVKGAYPTHQGRDYSYAATPPYPPPAPPAAAYGEQRKSALDILESGQAWPDLPPPVVSAKGAWVWQPATAAAGERLADGQFAASAGSWTDPAPAFLRKPSWVATPPTPHSEAPPYPSSSCGDSIRFQGGAETPHSFVSHRGEWSRQQAFGGRNSGGSETPMENPFVYSSSADEYNRGAATSPLPHSAKPMGPFLGPHSQAGYLSSQNSRVPSSQYSTNNGDSSPFQYRSFARVSSSSASDDAASMLGLASYPQPPARGNSYSEDDQRLHPMVHDWGRQSRGPSPLTSPRIRNGDGNMSHSASTLDLGDEYASADHAECDKPDVGLLSQQPKRKSALKKSTYHDPFSAAVDHAEDGGRAGGPQRYARFARQPESPSKEALLHRHYDDSRYEYDDDADHTVQGAVPQRLGRWSDSSALEEDWKKRGVRSTTYGGLIDVYAAAKEEDGGDKSCSHEDEVTMSQVPVAGRHLYPQNQHQKGGAQRRIQHSQGVTTY